MNEAAVDDARSTHRWSVCSSRLTLAYARRGAGWHLNATIDRAAGVAAQLADLSANVPTALETIRRAAVSR